MTVADPFAGLPRRHFRLIAADPDPDPDHGWEGRDAAGNYIEALGAIRAGIVASGQARLDAGDIPAILRRGTPENLKARGLA